MPFAPDASENAFAQGDVRHQFGVARGDRDRALGQHHVHVRQQRAEERPLAVELLEERHALVGMLLDPGLHRAAKTVPSRQHQPALRPAEHPGNGAEVLDLAGFLARRRPAADVERGDLRDDGRGPEIIGKPLGFIDQPAIGLEGQRRQLLHRLQIFRAGRAVLWLQQACLERRRGKNFQIVSSRPRCWNICWR